MSNTQKLTDNPVKEIIFEKDYIVLIRDGCYTVISASDFLDYFVNGGEGVCDSVMNCWHSMGDFAGLHIDENGEFADCNCEYDNNPRIHFPKGEGIKIITEANQARFSDSVYILKNGEDKFDLIVVDEAGVKRSLASSSGGVTISSIGNGIPVLKSSSEIRSLKSSDNSLDVELETNDNGETGNIDVKGKVIGGQNLDSSGFNIYKELKDKRLHFLPIVPLNIAMKYLTDTEGNVIGLQIGNPDTFAFKTFYVNENYPTADGDGSLSKPYKTFEACWNEYVSPLENDLSRPGEKYNEAYPKYKGAKIICLSNIYTDRNPSINGLTIELPNLDTTFYYTGILPYMFDTEIIYPLMSKTGTILQDGIYMNLTGKGVFTRTDDINRGLVRSWGTNRNSDVSHFSPASSIYIAEELTFKEALPVESGKSWTDIKKYTNGVEVTLESIYGSRYIATSSPLYQPVIGKSLFNVQYRNSFPAQTIQFKGRIKIISFSQASLYVRDALVDNQGAVEQSGMSDRVAYNGSTANDTIAPVGDTWIRYLPHTGKYQVYADDKALMRYKEHACSERQGFGHFGWDASIYLHNTAYFIELGCGFSAINHFNSFFKLDSLTKNLSIGTGGSGKISEIYVPNAQYLIYGGVSGFGEYIFATAINTIILAFKELKPASNSKISFQTQGTLLGLKGKPIISGIVEYTNATNAELQGGVVINGLFKDASKSGAINSL